MPLVDGKLMSAQDALAKGLCPECGADFKTENAIAHLNSHWQGFIPVDKRGDKARQRQAMLQKYVADKNVRTTNMPPPVAAKPADLP
ncbi:MAG: hypothetical protein WCA44_09060 [Acidobacteriaceae bacterium]